MKCKHLEVERYVPETPRSWTRMERCFACGATRILCLTDSGKLVPRSAWSKPAPGQEVKP